MAAALYKAAVLKHTLGETGWIHDMGWGGQAGGQVQQGV